MTTKTVRNMTFGLMAVLTTIMTGCKTTLPTVDQMTALGEASGYTTAYVLNNQVKVDDATRNKIIEITTEVEKYIPSTNETFASTWTPMVKALTDKYVAAGELTQAQADRVVSDFGYITSLLDAYIEKKGVKPYQELVDAFVHGFCDRFLIAFRPANTVSASVANTKLDAFTYGYLSAKIK